MITYVSIVEVQDSPATKYAHQTVIKSAKMGFPAMGKPIFLV